MNDEKFVGISNYTFEFLDNRLAGFSVGYAKPKWKDVSQFTEKLAEIFNLPNVENWNTQPSGTKSIQCENYLVSTQVLNNQNDSSSVFGIYDSQLGQIIEKRERKSEETQREEDIKTFKP